MLVVEVEFLPADAADVVQVIEILGVDIPQFIRQRGVRMRDPDDPRIPMVHHRRRKRDRRPHLQIVKEGDLVDLERMPRALLVQMEAIQQHHVQVQVHRRLVQQLEDPELVQEIVLQVRVMDVHPKFGF